MQLTQTVKVYGEVITVALCDPATGTFTEQRVHTAACHQLLDLAFGTHGNGKEHAVESTGIKDESLAGGPLAAHRVESTGICRATPRIFLKNNGNLIFNKGIQVIHADSDNDSRVSQPPTQ